MCGRALYFDLGFSQSVQTPVQSPRFPESLLSQLLQFPLCKTNPYIQTCSTLHGRVDTYNKSFDKYNVEDGNFELYSKADDKLIDRLEEENVTIYENFYKEETLKVHNNEKLREDDQSTIRFYINRDDIDKVDDKEGRLEEDINEITLDRMYSVNNNIKIGDIINVGTRALKVTGYVALSDYSCLFSNNSDTMFDSLKFGVGVVSESCFDMYDDTHIHYVYSWKYDNNPSYDIE